MKVLLSRRTMFLTTWFLMAGLTGIAALAVPSQAAPMSFKVALTGAQQVPPVQTAATATAAGWRRRSPRGK